MTDTNRSPTLWTPREREVALLVMQGHGNKAIAQIIGLSPYTVSDYVCRAKVKAGVQNRIQLAVYAAREQQGGGASVRRVA